MFIPAGLDASELIAASTGITVNDAIKRFSQLSIEEEEVCIFNISHNSMLA
jgi:hypothetical protein